MRSLRWHGRDHQPHRECSRPKKPLSSRCGQVEWMGGHVATLMNERNGENECTFTSITEGRDREEVSTRPNLTRLTLSTAAKGAKAWYNKPKTPRSIIILQVYQRASSVAQGRTKLIRPYCTPDVGLPHEICPPPILCSVRTYMLQINLSDTCTQQSFSQCQSVCKLELLPSDDRRAAVELIKPCSQWEFPRTDLSDVTM